MIETTNQKVVTDESLEIKLKELQAKKAEERTKEENDELVNLKEERQTRYQKKIDKLTWEAKSAQEERDRVKAELEEERRKKERPVSTNPFSKKDMEKVGSKEFFTDESLGLMVQSGEITESQAYKHQQERLEEKAAEKAYQRIKQEEFANSFEKTLKADIEDTYKQYPQFDNNNPSFDPDDPLYIEANRVFREFFRNEDGTIRDSKAFSKSIREAKRNLKISDTRPDVTDEMTIDAPNPSRSVTKSKVDVTLDDNEKSLAIRQYVHGGIVNPATQRQYTENEAIAKMLNAKKARIGRVS